uniref:NADH-ubiquinone oxidoreductase chain 2 n=1 Tax=Tenodera sinensis TaxID=406589 RepID=A0A172QHN3_9NEOP|nr:NADH dehydrogenase subunit 2 [Tenodera sinensis]AND97210.1 NADH dehydrogenase subunit 2 [Tenodera sinensis]APD14875.1 NADH dehydrogenase subunit 2 [Tenodera sinensis]
MPNNSTKILFLSTLISGVLISLCANSWMGAWMGLEINLLSFIPLLSSNKNMYSTEASLKYFLIQAIASSTLLFLILLKTNIQEMFYISKMNTWNNLMMLPLMMKIAASPFYWWLPSVMEGLSWMNCFILLSIQKIAPLMLISYMITNNYFIQFIIISSAFIGAIGGLNQISLRKILSFSSINHIGWMLTTMIMGSNLWLMYFTIYTINIISIISMTAMINLSYISQTFNSMNNKKIIKFTLFIAMLSLGGLPPFLGFFPKWIAIQFMAQNLMIITSIILIMSSLLTLYYYMRIMYTTLMMSNSEVMWMISIYPSNMHSKMIMFSLSILMLGMITCTLMLWMY